MIRLMETDFGHWDCPGVGDEVTVKGGENRGLYVIDAIYDRADFPGIKPGYVMVSLGRKEG